jgi:hypothetical protein
MLRILFLLVSIILLIGLISSLTQGATRDFAVEVSAVVEDTPPSVIFTWRVDPSASQIWVFRKSMTDPDWGDPLTILPGSATGYQDETVSSGQAYEYSFRKTRGIIDRIFQLPPDTPVTFTIYDSWGDGICCQHGLGSYSVNNDGITEVSGGCFGESESTVFVTGSEGSVGISLTFDAFPAETTWTIKEDSSGNILVQDGPFEAAKFGHIFAGIRYPIIEDRGTVLMVVSDYLYGSILPEIERLSYDLIADGYRVRKQIVTGNLTVPDVKDLIVDAAQEDPDIGSLIILGHVPVPYSGNLLGVHSNHQGAWPADLYYGDLDGVWTDTTVNNTTATWPENHNVPGDGKFDQTFLPSDVELQVGRIDLSYMPGFPVDEIELMRRYLDRNHAYRMAEIVPIRRGLIDDNVGEADGLAFAAVGWRNFTALLGQNTVFERDYFETMEHESYLWSYGCGGGSNVSCAGVGTTGDFAERNVQTVFTALYGSYFGDWDKPHNLLRAPLASDGWPLVCFWAGRPTWHLHHMALGHSIGYSTRLSQNNITEYMVSDGQRQISTALMGDPTLRMHVVPPISNLQLKWEHLGIQLTWDPSPDADEGYHIYRSSDVNGQFERMNETAVFNSTYLDTSPFPGTNVYMVRAMKRETSGSGTYINLSSGIFATINTTPDPTPTPSGTSLKTRLELSGNPVHPFDIFWVKGFLDNPDAPLQQIPVVFILDIFQSYYFWPSWTLFDPPDHPDIDFLRLDIPTGTTPLNVIQPVEWPDTGQVQVSGLVFYGAMLSRDLNTVIGIPAIVEWGYGP